MSSSKKLHADVLDFNETEEVARICSKMKSGLRDTLHRRGYVIGISGGVDSAVSAALAVAAVGKKKVFGLLLPEYDSSPESVTLGEKLAKQLEIEFRIEDIGPSLKAIGCYQWRDEAIRKYFPEYADDWKCKINISGGLTGAFNHFILVVQSPLGDIQERRMNLKEYLQIVAATNYKQRVRKTVEYFHADRLNYAVIGTPNRLEYDQGFFVKNGDGSADVKPIAHLYKTQVYRLANYFGLPEEICTAKPTTDTYSMPQGQDEFYFALPYDKMDIVLWSHNHNISKDELAEYFKITVDQASFLYKDIEAKRKATNYLHEKPVLVDPVEEMLAR